MSLLAASALLVSCGSHGASAVPACRAGQLRSDVFFQGGAGVMIGGYRVRNRSGPSCRLGGRPHVVLIRGDGQRVRLSVHAAARTMTPGTPRRPVLEPGQAAIAWMNWESYCGSYGRRPFVVRLTLTTGTRISAPIPPLSLGAKCNPTGRNHPGPGRGSMSVDSFSEPAR